MSTSKFEIERIVRSHPSELKYLFKSPTEDRRRLTKIIAHLVPYRVGVEFECFGCLTQHLAPMHIDNKPIYQNNHIVPRSSRQDYVKNKLRLTDFSEDCTSWNETRELNGDFNEIRLSFMGYKELIPFFNSLEYMNQYCKIPSEKGGIHIHIGCKNLSEFKDYALLWFDRDRILSRTLEIFGGYKGSYNNKHASFHKSNYIRLTDFDTVEFRIGHLTYDYKTIIHWIIECSKLVTQCRYDWYHKANISVRKSNSSDSTHQDYVDRVAIAASIIDQSAYQRLISRADLSSFSDAGTYTVSAYGQNGYISLVDHAYTYRDRGE